MSTTTQSFSLACQCGATALSMAGAPITVATCYCESCKAAALQFEEESAISLIGAGGGIDYVLFRKDRIALLRGQDNLMDRRRTIGSPTRRVFATCCNSPMFLDFAPGYWISLYRANLVNQTPAPGSRTYTTKFFFKLIGAWAAMGFRRPTLSF